MNKFTDLNTKDLMDTNGGEVVIAVVCALIAAGTAIGTAAGVSRKNR
ncbi:class IIb bacteriocin, lactobin A/cerein 7B family [Ruminococcus sp.]|jgi:lactobin A/cerein 7B family class IIb bacteriocin|nr:class IIb bacteriocin, lactobin A/cerein 7B family [Ruminococcus sp.]